MQELITQIFERTKEGVQHDMLLEKGQKAWRNLNCENQWDIVWYSNLHDIIKELSIMNIFL